MERSPARRGLFTTAVAAGALLLTAGTAHADLSPGELRSTTDQYLFELSLDDFTRTRAEQPHADQLDWSSDGCSMSPDEPLGFKFRTSCDRHDFGYRNYKKQERFTEPNRKEIDDNFRDDMYTACGDNLACKGTANIYYFAVREFGGVSGSTAEAVEHAQIQQLPSTADEPLRFQAVNAAGHLVQITATD
ncbi:phospholipase A2 [Saccharopolyspora kobensis]|uniref:Phospholipase A2 n=1 Tax=Saccharopolyspora kobensis TaxID=146035 RepID=A0A1H6BXY9_9PSEU|nr:phospholipase [Saccharopolyspora kobensis]SEG65561.1 phospholipase A2 [Saccharopolyspora kobensis]SFC20239.1 phospholipase A2 [Saccharopolyspora kobensis]